MTVHNRLVWAGNFNGTVALRNVYYYKTSFTTIGTTQAQTIFDALMDTTGLCAELSSKVHTDGCYASHWTGPADGIWWDTVNDVRKADPPWTLGVLLTLSGLDGVVGTDDLGPMVAALATAYTQTKRVRGHKYIPGIPESGQTTGQVDGTLATAMSAFATAWKTPITIGSDSAVPELWGYKTGFSDITNVVHRLNISTQRRRQYGRGV